MNGLLEAGIQHATRWCSLNDVQPPAVEIYEGKPTFAACAYYRYGRIHIWPRACAAVGMAGRSWSYPGYVVDRTPYGVIAHELGHHVEGAHGARGGINARKWRRMTQDKPLTGYCPNDNEWFAEMFRLFVTNPTLLAALRPATWTLLKERWPVYAEQREWQQVLANVPRQLAAARNKIHQSTL